MLQPGRGPVPHIGRGARRRAPPAGDTIVGAALGILIAFVAWRPILLRTELAWGTPATPRGGRGVAAPRRLFCPICPPNFFFLSLSLYLRGLKSV